MVDPLEPVLHGPCIAILEWGTGSGSTIAEVDFAKRARSFRSPDPFSKFQPGATATTAMGPSASTASSPPSIQSPTTTKWSSSYPATVLAPPPAAPRAPSTSDRSRPARPAPWSCPTSRSRSGDAFGDGHDHDRHRHRRWLRIICREGRAVHLRRRSGTADRALWPRRNRYRPQRGDRHDRSASDRLRAVSLAMRRVS